MSIVCLQVGQCGLQVGQSLFQVLQEYVPSCSMRLFVEFPSMKTLCLTQLNKIKRANGHPSHIQYPLNVWKQLLVDTEKKTWSKRQRESSISLFTASVVQLDASGRGNNWAHGYSDTDGLEKMREEFRKLIEQESRFAGTCILSSVAGGTGSGLGSSDFETIIDRLLEDIRDYYPKNFILSCPVMPFQSGETALQNYNSLMSLTWMQRFSDIICLSYNDHLLHALTKQMELGSFRSANPVKLFDLNEYIGHSLAGVILPIHPVTPSQSDLRKLNIGKMKPFDAWSLIEDVTPIPDMKMTQLASSRLISSLPNGSKLESLASWDDTTTSLLRNIHNSPESEYKHQSLFRNIYSRGVQSQDYYTRHLPSINKKIDQRLGRTILEETSNHSQSFLHGLDAKSNLKSLTVLTNSTLPTKFLGDLISKVELKLEVGAYLHWFENYIPDMKEELQYAVNTMMSVQNAYRDFSI